ncbi:MAG TPA: hypothetical protein VEU32_02045 [Burkholderiales bacterium]|nr:hypothetical protein [Burkholderiales bacterium]
MRALAVLLLAPALACAQNWNDLIKKGADAALQELKKQQAQKPAPAKPASQPTTPASQPATQSAPQGKAAQPIPLYPDEVSFVAPSATTKLADGERCFSRGEDDFGASTKVLCPPRKKVSQQDIFKTEPARDAYPTRLSDTLVSPRIIVANPYLSLDSGIFWNISGMTCDADGSLRLSATAYQKKNGASYASGLWRVAPEGQITPIAAKPFSLEITSRYPYCNAPFQKTNMAASALAPLAPMKDGTLLSASGGSILRIRPDGMINRFAGHDVCAAPNANGEGYADGALTQARFKGILSLLEDPQGNVWVGEDIYTEDMKPNRTLRKISGGHVTTVLTPDRVFPEGDAFNVKIFDDLAWDPVHSELVAAGMHLATTPRDYISTVWRIKPDGETRRVFLSRALGPGGAARSGTVSAMTVDAHGDILIAVTKNANGSATQILRIDANGAVSVVSGAPRRGTNVLHADGPASEAVINHPGRMCMDGQGTLYLQEKNLIRRMAPDGRVTTWVY